MVALLIRHWLLRRADPRESTASRGKERVTRIDTGLLRQHARHAAVIGVRRYPQRPGIWLRTTQDGRQRRYKIFEHDGVLYATVGILLPVAVPTRTLPGHWLPIERIED